MRVVATQGLRTLPLLVVAALLTLQPAAAATSIAGRWPLPWRLDAIALVFLLGTWSTAALLAPTWRDMLRSIGLLLVLSPALLLDHILILPTVLLVFSAVLRWWRWVAAALLLLLGTMLLRYLGISSWHDSAAGAALRSGIFLLLAAAAAAGLRLYPLALLSERFDTLRLALAPIWLLPLLRSISWGPWNRGWALALVLLGAASLIWAAAAALWQADRQQRIERLAELWLAQALIAIGLVTPVGALAALWIVLTYGFGLGLIMAASRSRSGWSLWAAPLPPAVAFVATWLVQGATAASGAFLLTAVCWFAALLSGLAIIRLWPTGVRERSGIVSALAIASIATGFVAPLPLRLLIVPAVELLQGGLTPFGLFDIWPWVGIAALDSGQRRVAVLPSIAVALLVLVSGALVWLLGRLLGWSSARDNQDDRDPGVWEQLRELVWWSPGRRRRG